MSDQMRMIPTATDILDSDPDHFLAANWDIAAVNLACASGLRDAENIDIPAYLTQLDAMAQAVQKQTERSWRLFRIKPAEFQHSENVFRIFTMEHVLRMQFQVKYNPLVKEATSGGKSISSARSYEVFIHGILDPANRTGTCSSLPTFSVAVGRRLRYPLKLVRAPNHTFFRWENESERFNVQHTAAGSEIWPDERYHDWPQKWDAEMLAMNQRCRIWLHSLTPAQEVSKFLCNRALILRDGQRFEEALDALRAARRYDADNAAIADIWLNVEQRTSPLAAAVHG
jgi:hypothetical protein